MVRSLVTEETWSRDFRYEPPDALSPLARRLSGCSSCSAYTPGVTPALRVDLLRLPERLSGFADRPSLLAGRLSHPTLPVAGARIYNKVLSGEASRRDKPLHAVSDGCRGLCYVLLLESTVALPMLCRRPDARPDGFGLYLLHAGLVAV